MALQNSYVSMALRGMASLNQMHRTGPHIKKRPPRQPLDGKPFAKGVVLKTLIKKPKKPNSANRKCILVRLSTGKEMVAYIPGIGHNLQEHNIVLCRVGRLQDVPGVKLKAVRGVYDLAHVIKKNWWTEEPLDLYSLSSSAVTCNKCPIIQLFNTIHCFYYAPLFFLWKIMQLSRISVSSRGTGTRHSAVVEWPYLDSTGSTCLVVILSQQDKGGAGSDPCCELRCPGASQEIVNGIFTL